MSGDHRPHPGNRSGSTFSAHLVDTILTTTGFIYNISELWLVRVCPLCFSLKFQTRFCGKAPARAEGAIESPSGMQNLFIKLLTGLDLEHIQGRIEIVCSESSTLEPRTRVTE